ncbi:MAG: tetratricopeptide repeat protein [Cyanobacteria bacterium P01_F01_bin.143]
MIQKIDAVKSNCNQLEESRENLQNLLKNSPKNAKAILKLGRLCRQEKKRDEALKLFQEALALRPKMIWAYIQVATELKYFGKFAEAEQKLLKALDYSPNNFDVLMQLGELEQQKQQPEQALDYFQKALINHCNEVKPGVQIAKILHHIKLYNHEHFHNIHKKLNLVFSKFADQYNVLMFRGDFARKLGQRAEALSWFQLAIDKAELPAQKIKAQLREAEELEVLGDFHQAIENIETILQSNPENVDIQMRKVSILRKNVNFIEAKNICKNILSIKPNHLDCRLELARIYSQSGQAETAILLLEETHQLLEPNVKVLRLLGSLNQALENWEIANEWYQKASQEYPDNPHTYYDLANLNFIQGKTQLAINILQEAQVKLPHSIEIPLKLAEFQRLLGNLELSHQLLIEQLNRIPDNIEVLWDLCYLHMEQGDYSLALNILDKISTDNQGWIRKTEQRRANIYFYQYDYPKAEEHLRKTISLAPIAPYERDRLATILMLTGRIDEARQEFRIATQEFGLKISPDKFVVPLRSHAAMITNDIGINPPLRKKLQAAEQEIGAEKILVLCSILAQEPNYLGSALYLARELRVQGIFEQLQQALSEKSSNFPAIPKRIVQFWDETQVPQEVQAICQSWIDLNPDYEYIRFSRKTAVAFVKEHYDKKVLKAFSRCDQPAMQADFFRLAYLNKMGGFYADADDLCRQSLDNIVDLNPELVIIQEELAAIGNNFLGCVPGQSMVRTAFYQAIDNLSDYTSESPWFATGPGLMTSVVCSGLLPYLTYSDYQFWPRLLVLSQAQLKKIIYQHMSLPYKRTAKSWQNNAYKRRIKNLQTG